MATFTKSVGVLPYLGGTLDTAFQRSVLVRLTSEMMVWVHRQTNPNWIIGTIINTPGGVTSDSQPVVASQQLVVQSGLSGNSLFVNRLTDSTFLIVDQSVFCVTSSEYDGAGSDTPYWVCSVDNNVISVIDSGTFKVMGGNRTSSFRRTHSIWTQTDLIGGRTTGCFEIADNIVSIHHFEQTGWHYYNLIFNTTTGKLQVPSSTTQVADSALSTFSQSSSEWIRNTIPGRPELTMITRRSCTGGTSFATMRGSLSVILDSNGAIYMNTTATNSQLPTILPTISDSTGYAALTPMPGDQMLVTSLTDASIYSINYASKTWTLRNSRTFSAPPVTADSFSRFVFALDANYWLIASRRQFYYPSTSMRWKIVRRYDNNFIEQSAASADNGRNGFSVTPAGATYMSPLCSHPEIIDGKLFYWGHANDTNSNTLSWTVYNI